MHIRWGHAIAVAAVALGAIAATVVAGEALQVFIGFWFIALGGMLVAWGEIADTQFGASERRTGNWAALRALGLVALTVGSLLLSLPVVVEQLKLSETATEIYKVSIGFVACVALLGTVIALAAGRRTRQDPQGHDRAAKEG